MDGCTIYRYTGWQAHHAKPMGKCDPAIHLNCADLRNGALEHDRHR